jgi:hypothetical protein
MTTTDPGPRWLWRLAGALVLAHVVLIPVGLALQAGPLLTDGRQGIVDSYVEGNLTRSFTGGVIEAFGFVLLVPALVFLARAFGRTTPAGLWAAQSGLMCGVGYVAVTLAVGFPAGAAAMYGAQHGLDVDAAFALNNVRIFSYFLSLMLLGAATLGVAVSALADRTHTRWIGGFGVVTGVALLASTPLAGIGQQDWGGLVHLVWLVGVGVLLVRHRPDPAVGQTSETGPERAVVGHA